MLNSRSLQFWMHLVAFLSIVSNGHADTVGKYMNIANNIPKMEMKADKEAHTWARSARTILHLTSESIGESLVLANQAASERGDPLFCLPGGVHITALMINELIQKTYREISSQESDKNNMTVSQVALIGLTRQYPCEGGTRVDVAPTDSSALDSATHARESAPMTHMDGVLLPPPP